MTEAYSHIKERPVDPIGQTATAGDAYYNTTNAYDCAISGLPFFLGVTEKYPYKRETAPYRKQQIDMQKEPGEQTLTGWWLRAQSSFHYGAGIRFQEPVQGDTVPYRFNKSAGVDVFNVGKTTLLPDVEALKTSSSGNAILLEGGVDSSGVDFGLMADGANLYKITWSGSAWTSTAITWGGTGNILDICQDGVYYYAANATGIYRGPLTLASSGTSIFTHPSFIGSVTTVKMNWVKQRVIAGINNYLFEVTPVTSYTVTAGKIATNLATLKTNGIAHNFQVGTQVTVASVSATAFNGTWQITSVPDSTSFTYEVVAADSAWATTYTGTAVLATNNTLPIYSHPNSAWVWTGVCEGPNAIYASGYSGDSSAVYRLSLDASGQVPMLSKAVTAADMPRGEYITSLGSYIGKFMVFGTNKGIRVGTIDTSGYVSSGYITYGPLTTVTSGYDPASGTNLTPSIVNAEVKAIMFQDRFAYCTVSNYIDNGDGTYSSGLIKIDLSREIAPNQMAYATHLRVPSTNVVTDVAVFGRDNRIIIGVTGNGAYIQSNTKLCDSGYIQTGLIRYNTLEDKHFKLIKLRVQAPIVGNIKVSSVDTAGSVTDIITVTQDYDLTQDITTNVALPGESYAMRFTLYPLDATFTASTLNGYQLKALPAVKRNRLYTIPLLCYDFEGDRYNMIVGYEGRSIERIQALENIEAQGDVIIFQDFTTDEYVQGVIESMQFMRMTPPERRFKGFGGIIYVQLRTI